LTFYEAVHLHLPDFAMYAAQGIPQIDAEIAQKGLFRMATKQSVDFFLVNLHSQFISKK
jgi:hypothetical protein